MKTIMTILFLLAAFIAPAGITHAGEQGEKLKQLTTQLQGNPNNIALREEIIKLALTITPAPAVPEEAERRMARGIAAFQGAKSVSDYQSAASEFEQATNAAPWYGDAYYNLGLAQDKAGNYAGALQSLKFAALASPDNRDIKNLYYQIEYRRDQEKNKAKTAAAVAASLEPYRGNWIALRCIADEHGIDTGCNVNEYNGKNWRRLTNWGEVVIFPFKFSPDGTVEIQPPVGWNTVGTWGIYGNVTKIVGIPSGKLLVGSRAVEGSRVVEWTCHYDTDTRTNKALDRRLSDNSFLLSCDAPFDAKLPFDIGGSSLESNKRYHFIEFRRQ